jgi:hypothetical protein
LRRDLQAGSGKDGSARAGAITFGSVIMAMANPPVRHRPIAPTPRPPHSL